METDKSTMQNTQAPEHQSVPPIPDDNKCGNPAPQAPGTSEQSETNWLFQNLGHVAPIFLLLLVAIQVWPDFWQAYLGTAQYCPAEALHIRIAQEVAQATQYYAPMTSLPAQWPVYTWLILLLDGVLTPAMQWLVYPIASAGPALLALLAVWIFTRAAGFGAPAALAAALSTLCAPLFAPLFHFVGPSALATALMVLSLAMFCRGWQANSAWLALSGAFVCAGLAGLTGGPFFLLVPLAASLVFLCWRCTFSRGHGLDAIFGFLLLVLLIAGWLGSVILFTHAERYMQELFGSIYQPWKILRDKWWVAPAVAGIGLVPWLGVAFCASWGKVIGESWSSLKSSRKEKSGGAFVWLSLFMAILFAAIIPAQSTHSLAIALLCLTTPLVGKSLVALSMWGRRIFVSMSAILLLFVGIALIACHFDALLTLALGHLAWDGKELLGKILPQLQVLPAMGAGCIVAALFMMRFCRRVATVGGFLLYCAVVVTILHQPATLFIAPALGNIPEAGLYRVQQQTPEPTANRQEEDAQEVTPHEQKALDGAPEQPVLQPEHKDETRPTDEAKEI